jgi:hypothetical protein
MRRVTLRAIGSPFDLEDALNRSTSKPQSAEEAGWSDPLKLWVVWSSLMNGCVIKNRQSFMRLRHARLIASGERDHDFNQSSRQGELEYPGGVT